MYNTCTVQLYIHIVCISHVYVFIPPTIGFSRLSLLMEKAFLEDVKIRRSNMIIRYMHVVYILMALTFLAGNSNIECSFFMAINPMGFFFNESNIDSWDFPLIHYLIAFMRCKGLRFLYILNVIMILLMYACLKAF